MHDKTCVTVLDNCIILRLVAAFNKHIKSIYRIKHKFNLYDNFDFHLIGNLFACTSLRWILSAKSHACLMSVSRIMMMKRHSPCLCNAVYLLQIAVACLQTPNQACKLLIKQTQVVLDKARGRSFHFHTFISKHSLIIYVRSCVAVSRRT